MVFSLRTVTRFEVVLGRGTAERYDRGGEADDHVMALFTRGNCGIWKGGRHANIEPGLGNER